MFCNDIIQWLIYSNVVNPIINHSQKHHQWVLQSIPKCFFRPWPAATWVKQSLVTNISVSHRPANWTRKYTVWGMEHVGLWFDILALFENSVPKEQSLVHGWSNMICTCKLHCLVRVFGILQLFHQFLTTPQPFIEMVVNWHCYLLWKSRCAVVGSPWRLSSLHGLLAGGFWPRKLDFHVETETGCYECDDVLLVTLNRGIWWNIYEYFSYRSKNM